MCKHQQKFNHNTSINQGFTVLEVMIALLIIAVALGGAVYTVGRAASNEKILNDQTFARWVAMNRIAEEKIKRSFPKTGNTNGSETMAGIKWEWQQKTLNTEIKEVRRIEVSVWQEGRKKEGVSAMVVGFLTQQN